jgi:hypothetical protein
MLQAKAPFCLPGEDCFVDVDHKRLALEVKNLALILSGYLEQRMAEERQTDVRGGMNGLR